MMAGTPRRTKKTSGRTSRAATYPAFPDQCRDKKHIQKPEPIQQSQPFKSAYPAKIPPINPPAYNRAGLLRRFIIQPVYFPVLLFDSLPPGITLFLRLGFCHGIGGSAAALLEPMPERRLLTSWVSTAASENIRREKTSAVPYIPASCRPGCIPRIPQTSAPNRAEDAHANTSTPGSYEDQLVHGVEKWKGGGEDEDMDGG